MDTKWFPVFWPFEALDWLVDKTDDHWSTFVLVMAVFIPFFIVTFPLCIVLQWIIFLAALVAAPFVSIYRLVKGMM